MQDSEARVLAQECYQVGLTIANHGERVRRRTTLLRIVNVVVSMMVFISLVPQFSTAIGPVGISMVSLLAGLVLLLDTVIPLFVGKDSPERYEDYARYILGYKDHIEETLSSSSLTPAIKDARLIEVARLAKTNLRDVRSKWPNLIASAASQEPQKSLETTK